MIPQIALVLWIIISIILFASLSPLRAFLITYVVGILFLPVEITTHDGYHIGSIVFTQSLRIEKFTACHIGAILGTLFFAPHVLRRYRFQWLDLAFAVVIVGQFLTSMTNDLGAKDGFSNGLQSLRDYLPILILSRLYITSFADLLEAMRAIIGGAFIYSAICILEWRLSPQFHTYLYGYFQHSFEEFVRFDHFRPVGFLRHAIELSSFMALSSILAAWLCYKRLFKPLWNFVPGWFVLPALLLGLSATMTFSGYGAFILCASLLAALLLLRTRWLLLVLPLIAVVWMAGRYTGTIDSSSMLSLVKSVDASRADSLQYRFQAEDLNLRLATQSAFLGQGAQHGAARDEEGNFVLALDSQWLITLIFYGLVGLVGWFLLWSSSIFETVLRWQRLSPDARSLAAVVCILLGGQFIDFLFNNFPSMFLLILNVGLISALQHFKPAPARSRARIPNFNVNPQPAAYAGRGVGRAP